MRPFELEIRGPAASTFADELEAWLGEHFEATVDRTHPRPEPEDTMKAIDPATAIAVATFVITIPSAIAASMDIVERVRKARGIEALRERVAQLEQALEAHVTLRVEGHSPRALTEAETSSVLEQLEEGRDGGEV